MIILLKAAYKFNEFPTKIQCHSLEIKKKQSKRSYEAQKTKKEWAK